jgi:hypothetical protein
MGVNNRGWTETQYGLLDASGTLEKGRVAINADGFTLDLGTLGGPNSWDNPFGGEINDRGEAVGYSETSVPDPDGEDVCGFGTDLTCRPFLWQNYHMSAPNLEVNVIGVYPFLPARIRELTGPSLILLEDLMELVKELAIEIHLDEYDLGSLVSELGQQQSHSQKGPL